MAVSKEKWNQAFQLLSQFERKVLDPSLFKWEYFEEVLGISKPTFWRNEGFRSEHSRVRKLVNKYKNNNADYDIEQSKLSIKDQQITDLKARIINLEQQLDNERERLAYAAIVARQADIDPDRFMKQSPLLKAKSKEKEKSSKVADLSDATLDRFRKK
mgnify:CR=1 FL=1